MKVALAQINCTVGDNCTTGPSCTAGLACTSSAACLSPTEPSSWGQIKEMFLDEE